VHIAKRQTVFVVFDRVCDHAAIRDHSAAVKLPIGLDKVRSFSVNQEGQLWFADGEVSDAVAGWTSPSVQTA